MATHFATTPIRMPLSKKNFDQMYRLTKWYADLDELNKHVDVSFPDRFHERVFDKQCELVEELDFDKDDSYGFLFEDDKVYIEINNSDEALVYLELYSE